MAGQSLGQFQHQGTREREFVGGRAIVGQGMVRLGIHHEQGVVVSTEGGWPQVPDDQGICLRCSLARACASSCSLSAAKPTQ